MIPINTLTIGLAADININMIWLYVWLEVVLRGDVHGTGCSNWAKGRDPSGSWVQPRSTNGTASLMLDHTYALMCAF